MRPASSKARQANLSYQAVDEELTDQIKKLTLLEGDRLEFKKQAEDTQAKNQEWIDKLRQENRKLKEQRDDIICRKRANTTVDSRMSKTTTTMGEVRDETYWRRELDKQRFLTKTLRTSLTNMQDKLKDVESNKISYIEESPLMRNIRILENRLDKVMIKYNEANAMRDTYEAVVKRLKEERIGYDNQVTAIERSLKGKESDFEELLLLAHDASHAKEMAQAELKKFQHKRSAMKDLRDQYISEKKDNIENLKLQIENGPGSMVNKSKIHQPKFQNEAANEEQELEDYEEAFKKLKQATGVTDANQIIQKFKTQGMTTKSLEQLRERYKGIIQNLRKEREQIKDRLNKTKYEGTTTTSDKRKVDEYEAMLDKAVSEGQRAKAKYQKTSKMLVNVKVAIQHLATYLEFMRTEPSTSEDTTSEDLLKEINKQIKQCYERIKKDPYFKSETFKQTTAAMEKYINRGGDGTGPVNTNLQRLIKKEGQDSGNQYEQEIDQAANERIKNRNQPTPKPVMNRVFRKFKA